MGLATFPVAPMKAQLGSLPAAAHDEQWAYEIKWDGYRCITHLDRGQVRLQSLSGLDMTATYPDLEGLGAKVNASQAVLDGELVALDDQGRPSFARLQHGSGPVALYLFDVLRIDDHDTTGLGYLDRRRLLEQLVEPGRRHLVPSYRIGDGAALFEATAAQQLEGIMAKRIESIYQPGKRSPNWRKIKHRRQLRVTIGGYTIGDGHRADSFGALLVGTDSEHGLQFRGGIGTGFNQRALSDLTAALTELTIDDCPFTAAPSGYRGRARWVEPVIDIEVEMTELTNDGQIRHGTFLGLATDRRSQAHQR